MKSAAHSSRKKEHVRNVKNYSEGLKGSNIANHSWIHNHSIAFENAWAGVVGKISGEIQVRPFFRLSQLSFHPSGVGK